MGLNKKEITVVWVAGLLHDLGKLRVKKWVEDRSLTPQEWVELKKHPNISAALVKKLVRSKETSEIVRYHHEDWNGGGYYGLKGKKNSFRVTHS